MRPKVDLKKAIKHALKKASTPPDNQRGVDHTFSEMLCTKYQSKNYIVRNNAILDYCDRLTYNKKVHR